MTLRFKDRVAIVTGATSGIGRATALEFAREGAAVVLAARRADKGEDLAREICDCGGNAVFVRTDVSDGEAVRNLVARTMAVYGRLDCAFNNAGVSGEAFRSTAEQSEANWDAIMATNLKGMWWCMKHEIPVLLASGGGTIVNNASDLAMVGSDLGVCPYVVSKHGVLGLTRAAAIEYSRQGIRVNAVCPSYTNTEMLAPALASEPEQFQRHVANHVPMGRIADPLEVARAVLWLCAPESSFVTGQSLAIDGGVLAK
jgi:A-factor type gamma-butyrolactone 1'-reductase (1S-forming)